MAITYFFVMFHFICIATFFDEITRVANTQEKMEKYLLSSECIVRLKRGGTSLREKAGFKGKQANGVGTQLMKGDRQVTACTALLPCYCYDVHTSPASA
jgi:hypothetical protein